MLLMFLQFSFKSSRKVSMCLRAKSLQSYLTLCEPMDCSPPGFFVLGILQQEYWSGLPCPPPGDLPDPGIEPASLMSPALADEFFTTAATCEAQEGLKYLPKSGRNQLAQEDSITSQNWASHLPQVHFAKITCKYKPYLFCFPLQTFSGPQLVSSWCSEWGSL